MNNSNKKIVKLNGGLGNQMFQYAFAVALEQKWSEEILFDFSYFQEIHEENTIIRPFELEVFNTDCKPACDEALKLIINKNHRTLLEKVAWDWFKIKQYKPETNILRQNSAYTFEKKFLTQSDAYYYDGYFQNEKYFKHCRNELLQRFSLKGPLDEKNTRILEQIRKENSVSIHIRRGDYVTLESANTLHGLCSLEYYEKAIKYIAKKVKNPHYFLFSDDVKWVIENLKIDCPYTVIDFNQDKGYLDMELMKHCKHNIIANSSFSWWGAWLNENSKKIVIAPQNWIAANQKCDIVPNEWVKL